MTLTTESNRTGAVTDLEVVVGRQHVRPPVVGEGAKLAIALEAAWVALQLHVPITFDALESTVNILMIPLIKSHQLQVSHSPRQVPTIISLNKTVEIVKTRWPARELTASSLTLLPTRGLQPLFWWTHQALGKVLSNAAINCHATARIASLLMKHPMVRALYTNLHQFPHIRA